MSLQLADQLMCGSIVDATGAVGRGRQQVLTSEVEANIENFILVTRQCSQTATCNDKTWSVSEHHIDLKGQDTYARF